MPSTGILVGDAGLSAAIVQALTNFLKLNVLDKVIDPTSTLYDWVTRGMVFILTLLVNAGAYVAEGGTLSGAWAIIIAGLASTGISLGNFHLGSFVRGQRKVNLTQGKTASTVVTAPSANPIIESKPKPIVAPIQDPLVTHNEPVQVHTEPVRAEASLTPPLESSPMAVPTIAPTLVGDPVKEVIKPEETK